MYLRAADGKMNTNSSGFGVCFDWRNLKHGWSQQRATGMMNFFQTLISSLDLAILVNM